MRARLRSVMSQLLRLEEASEAVDHYSDAIRYMMLSDLERELYSIVKQPEAPRFTGLIEALGLGKIDE